MAEDLQRALDPLAHRRLGDSLEPGDLAHRNLLGRLDLRATRGAGRSLLYFACIGLGFGVAAKVARRWYEDDNKSKYDEV